MGIEPPSRSSRFYVNAHHPRQMFEKVFDRLFEIMATKAVGRRKFRFKNKLVRFDSTVIDACLSISNWTTFATPRA